MAPVVSVYPASAESTEHERLMRFQSRLPGRGCAYYKKKEEKDGTQQPRLNAGVVPSVALPAQDAHII